jgi:cytochrome c-type biogenesis protein CcmH/NrfG
MTTMARTKGFTPDERAFADGEPGRGLAAIAADCPAPALLSAAANGALPDDLAMRVGTHLDGCAICRQVQSDLLAVDVEMDALEDVRVRRRLTRQRGTPVWRIAALAASVTIAAGGATLARRAFDAGAVPAAPAVARSVTPPPSVNLLAASKLEPRLDAAVLTWRGAEDDFMLALATALKPYEANDFKAASAALERLGARNPNRAEPALYLGICRLLMDRPVDAEKALRRAASIAGPHVEDARWYLAVATYQNGRRTESRQLLADMCRANGARGAEACLARDQAGEPR